MLEKVEEQSNIAMTWFESLKVTTWKWVQESLIFLFRVINLNKCELKYDNNIWETKTAKLLGITIDNNLKFD